MGRKRKGEIKYWASRGAYCCWIAERQEVLAKGPDDGPTGPTFKEALTQYRKLLELETGKGTDDYLVSACLNQYRISLAERRESQVPQTFDSLARSFCERYGKIAVSELRPHHVESWLREQSQWNDTSKHNAGRIIMGAVSWARKKGFIKTDPIAGCVDLPPQTMRGREARMSDDLMDLLIEEGRGGLMKRPHFSQLLLALRLTGARPIELRSAEAHNYVKGRLVFRWNTTVGYRHKTAKKTQRDRTIYLNDELRSHVEDMVKKYPSGPLFRTPYEKKWSRTSLQNKWAWLLKREAVVKYCGEQGIDTRTLKIYNFRHTFISDFIDATSDVYTCAQICGTSVNMIERRYGHPDVDRVHAKYLAFIASR